MTGSLSGSTLCQPPPAPRWPSFAQRGGPAPRRRSSGVRASNVSGHAGTARLRTRPAAGRASTPASSSRSQRNPSGTQRRRGPAPARMAPAPSTTAAPAGQTASRRTTFVSKSWYNPRLYDGRFTTTVGMETATTGGIAPSYLARRAVPTMIGRRSSPGWKPVLIGCPINRRLPAHPDGRVRAPTVIPAKRMGALRVAGRTRATELLVDGDHAGADR